MEWLLNFIGIWLIYIAVFYDRKVFKIPIFSKKWWIIFLLVSVGSLIILVNGRI